MDFDPIMYRGTDITEGVIVSAIFIILFATYFMYRKQNKYIMAAIVYLYRPQPAKLPKDTRKQDWLLFILMLAAVVIFGIKLVTLMVVISDSMVPEFQRGDIILSQSFDKTPAVGDIISFNVKDKNVAVSHRVVSVSGSSIRTKGDNNPTMDNFGVITQKDIVAKAIQVNGHPVVLKGAGIIFITDYSKTGVIYKFGDRYTFLQQLSATIRVWGGIITAVCIIAYLVLMVGDRKKGR